MNAEQLAKMVKGMHDQAPDLYRLALDLIAADNAKRALDLKYPAREVSAFERECLSFANRARTICDRVERRAAGREEG